MFGVAFVGEVMRDVLKALCRGCDSAVVTRQKLLPSAADNEAPVTVLNQAPGKEDMLFIHR